jgi:hypothetical protein
MNKQRGLALTSLLFWGVIFALGSVLVIKVMPEVVEYYKINKSVKSTAATASGLTVSEIRTAYSKYAEIENIQAITPADLDISKEGASVVVGFSYQKRIPLFTNVSLLIDFYGSSSGRE